MYILRPPAAGILYAPPPFIHPPPLEEGICRGGGVGVYKIWPRKKVPENICEIRRILGVLFDFSDMFADFFAGPQKQRKGQIGAEKSKPRSPPQVIIEPKTTLQPEKSICIHRFFCFGYAHKTPHLK